MMAADMWIFFLALSLRYVSSNDEDYCRNPYCQLHTVGAPLGSSVHLPCNFTRNNFNWVTWTHRTFESDLLSLSSKGRVIFLEPRNGRVKVFPNQASEGNFTIRIDELKYSDLGCYHCQQDSECCQVQLHAKEGHEDIQLQVFIIAGVSALVLLVVGVVCCLIYIARREDDASNADIAHVGPTAPPVEIVGMSSPPPPRGVPAGVDNLVYENDDQGPATANPTRNYCGVLAEPGRTQNSSGLYPNLTQFTFEREESQRTRQRFHIEFFSRIRQASSRHYYVNQSELKKQEAISKQNQKAGLERQKKTKENCEYKNPIYNSITEQLHRP